MRLPQEARPGIVDVQCVVSQGYQTDLVVAHVFSRIMRHVFSSFFAMIPLTALLHAAAPASTHAVAWEALAPLPAPNGGCMAGVYEGRIVVVGGTNWEGGVKNWLQDVHAYDSATQQWTTLKDALETPVAYGLDVLLDTPQLGGLFGGFLGGTDGKQALKVVATLSENKIRLRPKPDLPAAAVLMAGGVIEDQGLVVLVGGMDDPANLPGVTRMTHILQKKAVRRAADHPGKPFAVAASAAGRSELFVFGGMTYDAATQLPVNTDVAYAYSPAKDSWRPLKPLPKPNRGLAAVTLDTQHVYLAGGYTDDFTAEAVIYDMQADTYRPAPPLPIAAMVKLVRCGDFIYCLGGEDKKQSRTDKCFRMKVSELLK